MGLTTADARTQRHDLEQFTDESPSTLTMTDRHRRRPHPEPGEADHSAG